VRRLAAVAWLWCGCSTEFLLGDDTDGTTGDGATSSSASTTTVLTDDATMTAAAETMTGSASESPTTDDTGDPTGDEASETTTGDATTGTTTGQDTTSDTAAEATDGTEDPTAAETTAAETTGGEIGPGQCNELVDDEACEQYPACDWYGELGCSFDVCHDDAAPLCSELGYEACIDTQACAWDGVPKRGVCGLPTCGELELEGCIAEPACVWNERAMTCSLADCPPCAEAKGQPACLELAGCAWVEGVCVAD